MQRRSSTSSTREWTFSRAGAFAVTALTAAILFGSLLAAGTNDDLPRQAGKPQAHADAPVSPSRGAAKPGHAAPTFSEGELPHPSEIIDIETPSGKARLRALGVTVADVREMQALEAQLRGGAQ